VVAESAAAQLASVAERICPVRSFASVAGIATTLISHFTTVVNKFCSDQKSIV